MTALAAPAAASRYAPAVNDGVDRAIRVSAATIPGRGEEISATIDHMNSEMKRLRP